LTLSVSKVTPAVATKPPFRSTPPIVYGVLEDVLLRDLFGEVPLRRVVLLDEVASVRALDPAIRHVAFVFGVARRVVRAHHLVEHAVFGDVRCAEPGPQPLARVVLAHVVIEIVLAAVEAVRLVHALDHRLAHRLFARRDLRLAVARERAIARAAIGDLAHRRDLGHRAMYEATGLGRVVGGGVVVSSDLSRAARRAIAHLIAQLLRFS
jgi:hypothetical protein